MKITNLTMLTIDNETGAAHQGHPATAFTSFTFDLRKQTPLTFDTMFGSGEGVLDVLTPLVRESYSAPMLELLASDCGPSRSPTTPSFSSSAKAS